MYEPFHERLFMFVAGVGLGMMSAILVIVRKRLTCGFCNKKHPPRPENMTAVEYIKFYCDGKRWEAPPNVPVVLKARSFFRGREVVEEEGTAETAAGDLRDAENA